MADNRQNLLNEISDGLRGIRAAINSSNVTIPEDTPLQDYKNYIKEISQTHVDIGKQIFVFYTWAKTVDEALGYDKPSIHWNTETGDGWTVQETNDWQLDIPDNSNVSGSDPNVTYYTFVMFVSLSIGDSTGDGFVWPTPVQISGSKGEQGEKGDPGKDGIVAGLVLNTNINLYSLNQNVEQNKLAYDIEAYKRSSSYELVGGFLKYNNKSIGNWYADSPDSLFLTCPETNEPVYTLTVKVSSNTPIVKIIYGPTCQSISDVTIEYSNGDGKWGNEASISKENPNLYAKVKTKFGTWEYESEQKLIAKYPDEIENFNIIAYGTSWSTTEEPDEWIESMPDINAKACPPVLWAKYQIVHLDDAKNSEICVPILHRGTAGIPYNLIMAFEEELDVTDENNRPYVWTLNHWSDFSSSSYNAIKAASNVYMYVSGINSSTAVKEHVRIDDDKYLLNLGSFGGGGGKSDWNANEGEKGYIANRTHYDIWEDREEQFPNNHFFYIPESAKDIVCYYTTNIMSMEYDTISASDVNEFKDNGIFELAGNEGDKIAYHTGDYVGKIVYKVQTYVKTLDPKFVPQMVEITYNKLKTLRDHSKLIPGMQYRITDYKTIVSGVLRGTANMVRSAGYQFDIIVTADDVNVLNENARAIKHDFNNPNSDEAKYFASSNLAAWELKYCLDNDTNRFAWANNSNSGRGVIYYMKDEFNNECPYDFKNIQFRHPIYNSDPSIFWFTFTRTDRNFTYIEDMTISGRAFNNIIKPDVFNNIAKPNALSRVEINGNLLLSFMDDNFISGNIFEIGCLDNVVVNPVVHHIFDAYCTGNMIKNDSQFPGTPSYHFLSFVNRFTIDAVPTTDSSQYREIVVGNATVTGVAYGNIIDLFEK